jgi:hypothetical protein
MFAIGGGTVEMMRNLIADRLLPTPANRQARRAGHLTGLTPRAGPD